MLGVPISSCTNTAKSALPVEGPICQKAQWPIKIDRANGLGRGPSVKPKPSPILELGCTCTSMRCNTTDFPSHQVR